MGGQIGVIACVEGRCLGREAVDEHIVSGLGGCRRGRAGRSRGVYVGRFESGVDRLDRVVYRSLDRRAVEETDRAGMRETCVYDRLNRDRIPISYGIRP